MKSRRCTDKHRRSLAAAPFFSIVPGIQASTAGCPSFAESTTVYRDADVLPMPEDAIEVMTKAVACVEPGATALVGGKVLTFPFGMLPKLAMARYDLLSTLKDRKRAQARVVAAWCWKFATGGYPMPQNPGMFLPTPSNLLVLHTGCPQLQYSDEAIEFAEPAPRGGHKLSSAKLVEQWTAVSERILLAACQEAKKVGMRCHLKVPPLGVFVFQPVFGATTSRGEVVRCALEGLVAATRKLLPLGLGARVSCIELPDFTIDGHYTPSDDFVRVCSAYGVSIISGLKYARDALDSCYLREASFFAVAIAGDALALPGNRRGMCNVESMVANNTSFRKEASWVYNRAILDEGRHDVLAPPYSPENKSPSKSSSSNVTAAAAAAAGGGGGGGGEGSRDFLSDFVGEEPESLLEAPEE